jgi:hypothetical protein
VTRANRLAVAVLLVAMSCATAGTAQNMAVPDSVDRAVLRDYADTTVVVECLDAVVQQVDNETGAVLQLELRRAAPGVGACAGHNGLLAFVRDPAVTPENLAYLDMVVLNQQPHLLFVCGGQRTGALRSPGAVYPECRVRRPALGPET